MASGMSDLIVRLSLDTTQFEAPCPSSKDR